jgi:alkylation response protein AidB-like acyl-CoA dehydrogenase
MGFQFAEVATEIETARLLTYNAARLKASLTLLSRIMPVNHAQGVAGG